MVDRVRALKIETPVEGGTQTDYLPTEMNPTQDYIAVKGIAFNDDSNQLIEYLGRIITMKEPDSSQKPTYNVNGTVNNITFYNSTSSQITANRVALVTLAYSGIRPTSETWLIYDTDGTTVLRTVTFTYTYTGNQLTNTTVVYT